MQNSLFIALPTVARDEEILGILRSEFSRIHHASARDHALVEAKAIGTEITALIIGVQEKISRIDLAAFKNLGVIATLSAGVDHIDVSAVSESDIRLVTAKSANAESVAEHALTMILTQLKSLLNAHRAVCNGSDRAGLRQMPRELGNKTVGIIGAGPTARRLIDLLRPFRCKIVAWTRNPDRHRDLVKTGIEFSSINEIFGACEIVSLHIPLTDESRGMFSTDLVLTLPDRALLVNVARKGLLADVDLIHVCSIRDDLLLAIDDFGIAQEEYFNVAEGQSVFTPHIAGTTIESMRRMEIAVARELVECVKK